MTLHLEEFVKYYQKEFPGKPVPPMPKQVSDLNITERLAFENFDKGKLYQNLFGASGLGVGLPGDVQLRLQRNELQPQDATALRAANLPYFAEQCEALGEAIEKQQVIDETAKLQEINAAKAAKLEAWQKMTPMERLAANPPSDQAVAQARAAWNITGQPTYD